MKITNQSDCLSKKIILITGASDGIGKAVALDCAKHGASVILVGKTLKKLELIYDEFESLGYPEAILHPMDFEKATPDDFQLLHDSIESEFGHLDGLVNNAAWLGASTPIEHYDIELWYRVMQINLNAPFMLTRACLPLLTKSAQASIVFTLDNKENAYWGAYGASKSGLETLMKMLSEENEDKPLHVAGFNPGAVHTNFRTRAFPAEDNPTISQPSDISPYFTYLINADNKISNGKIYTLDDFC